MDSEPRVAVCVLRCEAAPYGIRVTITETSDLGSGVARERRLLRAGPILDEVRRFLAEAGVSE
ncbi:hypothetical protein ACQPZX_28135 [Actinoplanes sp. CA-142083]|jgi:hypothetical protein|uniref:hypothetical protein n=1 Tax=Actinoplanes sp. CA-142083 TaxID=3239903 RepID=UPI003D8EC4C9